MPDSYVNNLLASGEVVLIETRQHWMAAIRYALRPIVIMLIAAGLALLNQWLDFGDGWLGFINDLIHWVIIILLVVSIVWLPIDLVRWWSRRYLLTSRRAMRMDGVLRKRSFDSSLEQINDIRTEQSFFGRTLGYADLTIYTASDAANEVYTQLMDGLQFKKAVLEAKEAIRTGTLLTALPEGFIVKGGTNEASIKRFGKQEAPEAGVEAVAADDSAGSAPVAPAAAAAVVAVGSVIEPSGDVPGAAELAAPAPAFVADAQATAEDAVSGATLAIEEVTDVAAATGTDAAEAVAAAPARVEGVAADAIDDAGQTVGDITDVAATTGTDAVEAVAETPAKARTAAAHPAAEAKAAAEGVVDDATAAVGQATDVVTDAGSDAVDAVSSAVDDAGSAVEDAAQDAGDHISDLADNVVEESKPD